MTESTETITVEVACALPDKQKIVALTVVQGTTARQAVELSRIAGEFPEVAVGSAPLGVFGQALGTKGLPSAEEYVLQAGDRVEIYRPLLADPKEVRKQRAEKAREKRAQ
ncbi:MAG: RnfH family protein [Porticoccaceae bacterium]|nr:RnfH family protein [Porticoccaceae bacterium]